VGGMKTLSGQGQQQAEQFIYSTARVLERRRYEYLFGSGSADDVLTALAAYRNPDGGYGHALEPDGRGPGSQPVTVLTALGVLEEVGALRGELATEICEYLASITASDGGLPFVHPNIRDYPRAPWWSIPDVYEGSIIPTGNILALLLRNGVDHPWVARASRFCVQAISAMDESSLMPYSAKACIEFLDTTPARDWAQREAERIGELVRAKRLVALPGAEAAPIDGGVEGEMFYPHDLAETPDSLARAWFSEAEFEWSLDQLVDAQDKDGGWPLLWGVWTPVTEFEWRPVLTLLAMLTLRVHGRLEPAAQ